MSAGQGVDFFFVFGAVVLDVYLDVQIVEGVADVFEFFVEFVAVVAVPVLEDFEQRVRFS